MSESRVSENPLIPNAILLRLYRSMQTLRSGRTARLRCAPGEEAVRASSLLSLEQGDLVSEAGEGSALPEGPAKLPSLGSKTTRLLGALGAASALRLQASQRLVLLYAGADEFAGSVWREILGLAGSSALPIVFVLFPGGDPKKQGFLSDRAQSWGVPGMPVDAADAVAIYRVMQESVLRARAGDGPALLECVRWLPGESDSVDALFVMRRALRSRGLVGKQSRSPKE